MAVIDPDASVNSLFDATLERDAGPLVDPDLGQGAESIRVEPLIGLEWSRAIEPTGPVGSARRPAQARRAWIHRAPERQVVSLYDSARRVVREVPAPWWLRALAEGRIPSRLGGFAVEDQVSDLLAPRPGWCYVPWTGPGEDGYWEFVPPEDAGIGAGRPLIPTTLLFTDRHAGWLDVVAAHSDRIPEPIPVAGPADLRRRLPELEAARH